jgi:predicted transglutaminase-like cysteine proteinase
MVMMSCIMTTTYKELIRELKECDPLIAINRVNIYINQYQYASDFLTRGVSDYWRTIDELQEDQMGDCDDFCLAKFYILTKLEIP